MKNHVALSGVLTLLCLTLAVVPAMAGGVPAIFQTGHGTGKCMGMPGLIMHYRRLYLRDIQWSERGGDSRSDVDKLVVLWE